MEIKSYDKKSLWYSKNPQGFFSVKNFLENIEPFSQKLALYYRRVKKIQKGGAATVTKEETAVQVKRMQAGNQEAFDAIFAAYQQKAVRTAAFICGDTVLAEDVVQEAFVNCLLHIQELQNPYGFVTWFFKILTRCAWKACKQRAAISIEDAVLPMESVWDSYPSEQQAEYESLYAAIQTLSTKQRTVIILYYFNDFSIKEIAQILTAPQATVKTRLFAAKHRLQKTLTTKAQNREGAWKYEKQS